MSQSSNPLRYADICERYARLCPLDHQREEFERMADEWRRDHAAPGSGASAAE